jgi:hypothetical protein
VNGYHAVAPTEDARRAHGGGKERFVMPKGTEKQAKTNKPKLSTKEKKQKKKEKATTKDSK